jgi:hypothetical protein
MKEIATIASVVFAAIAAAGWFWAASIRIPPFAAAWAWLHA